MEYTTIETWCQNGDKRIFGWLSRPNTDQDVPLIICSHGFGKSAADGAVFARLMSPHGIAVYNFDFCGGSADSRSDGSSLEMSVMTEKEDLLAVLEEAKTWEGIDTSHIALLGVGQGGLVSALVADERPSDVACMILLYPAFVIPNDAHEMFGSRDSVPDTYQLWHGLQLSGKYALDVWELDPYEPHEYARPVLILHGEEDILVSVSVAHLVADSYADAQLRIISQAGHGFTDTEFRHALGWIFTFLENCGFPILEKREI